MDEESYSEDVQDSGGGLPPKASPLPWVLFGLSVLLGAIIAVVLLIRVDAAKSDADKARGEVTAAHDDAAKADSKVKELSAQVDQLKADNASLLNDKNACLQKAQTAAGAGGKPSAKASASSKKSKKKHH